LVLFSILFDNSLLLLILLSLFSIVNTYTYNNINNNTLQSNIFGNFFKNFGRNIRENFSKKKILSSLISILIVALFKIYIGNGFNPLTFSNFRSVLTSPVSIYGAMGLSGLFLSAKLFIASLIDSFHIKLSIFKQLFKLLLKLFKNHMFLKLPVVHNIDNKLEIKKHIIAVYMEQSESSNTKNKEESSTKGNSNTKNKDNSSTKENSNTKTKKGISNRQYNTKN
jgi:hypothetical protein